MPELPEVETVCVELSKHILNKRIIKILIHQKKYVHGPVDTAVNQTVIAVFRLGKYVILHLSSGNFIVIHLKMSGRLLVVKSDDIINKHLKISFIMTDDIRLDFQDVRKFGYLEYCSSIEFLEEKLGIEPISDYFTLQGFQEILKNKKKSALKPFLLDQKNIAGIGNIYADEICFVAGISPFSKVEMLTEEHYEKLFHAIKEVLKFAIQKQGTSLGKGLSNFKTPNGEEGRNYEGLKVYGQQGLNCLRCGNVIQKCKFASRGTHFCPNCQPDLNNESSCNRC